MKNMIIGQSGGPSSVINSSLAGAYCEGKKRGVDKVFGMIGGIKGFLDERYVNLDDYIKDAKDVQVLRQTPAAALGSCRYKLPNMEEDDEPYRRLFAIMKKLEIAYFIYIGGNDSMDTVLKLSEYGEKIGSPIRFIGSPKTIDNDLPVTDHTPGFGSAAKYIATSVKEIIRDSSVYDIPSVTVIEIMGRNAGWLTGSSILAKGTDCCGVDLIYLPEMSFSLDKFEDDVKKILKTKNTVVVAVSEALRDKNGDYITKSGSVHSSLDDFGHKIMSGTSSFLANYIGEKLGIKARGIEINTLQRCAAHCASKTDSDEAFLAGAESAKAALEYKTAEMVVILRISDEPYKIKVRTASIGEIANIEKTVPKEWITENGTSLSDDFVKYVKPLIEGEVELICENGLPVHMVIKDK